MDIETAFPLCHVRVSLEGREAEGDVYCVIRVDSDSISLEAASGRLERTPPRVGERVSIQATLPAGVCVLRGRVTECLAGHYVNIQVRQEGEIEFAQRRKRARAVVRWPVSVTSDVDGASAELQTLDANSIGIRAESAKPMVVGLRVRLTLRLGSSNESVACHGEVARCCEMDDGQFDIGIRFVDLGSDDEERMIRALLREILDV